MDRKRLYIITGAIAAFVVLVVALAVTAALQQSQTPQTPPKQDDYVGNLTCLPHKNAQEGQPQTLECAIGLKTTDSRHYALQDMPEESQNIEFATEIVVRGELIQPPADEKYDISGTIKVSTIEISVRE